jgi:hypothetical protein
VYCILRLEELCSSPPKGWQLPIPNLQAGFLTYPDGGECHVWERGTLKWRGLESSPHQAMSLDRTYSACRLVGWLWPGHRSTRCTDKSLNLHHTAGVSPAPTSPPLGASPLRDESLAVNTQHLQAVTYTFLHLFLNQREDTSPLQSPPQSLQAKGL